MKADSLQILILDVHISHVCQVLPLQTSPRIPGRMTQIERSQDAARHLGPPCTKQTANIGEPDS